MEYEYCLCTRHKTCRNETITILNKEIIMKKNIIIAVLLTVSGALSAYIYLNLNHHSKESIEHVDTEFCARHNISEGGCPWCDPSLIEKMGMCQEHNVPEALCSRCNADLIYGFKAENDWCAGHLLPESQCTICNGEGHPKCVNSSSDSRS